MFGPNLVPGATPFKPYRHLVDIREALGAVELLLQLELGLLQHAPLPRGQVFPAAVDVEDEHRQGRTIRLGLARGTRPDQ